MGLTVDFCDDADMFRAFSIVSDAFGDEEPYIDALFPNHRTPEGRTKGSERLLQMKHGDPHARFLKVTDTDTGEMIGMAKWLIYEDKPDSWDELDGDYWEDEEQKAYAAHLYTEFVKPRRAAVEAAQGRLVCMSILFSFFAFRKPALFLSSD